MTRNDPALTFKPLTPELWDDLQRLFGPRGACGGCWCMYWRLSRSEFVRRKGGGNKRAMRTLINAGTMPGILAYHGREAIGWCAVAPRDQYPALGRSRILKPIDDQPVWSISCLFVAREFRKQGTSVALIKAAIAHVKGKGGKIIEGYPVEPQHGPVADVFVWTGLASAFRRAGFRECARRSETRPIMRYYVRSANPRTQTPDSKRK